MSLRSPGRETANLGGAKIKTTAHGAHPTSGLLLPELGPNFQHERFFQSRNREAQAPGLACPLVLCWASS